MGTTEAGAEPGIRGRPPSGGASLAIEATGLVKCFGAIRAVAGVDLAVTAGTVYGLLGPNGAGKTTTVRILATLLAPDGGSARVLGHDVVRQAGAVRRRTALTGQFATVDDDLTGWENLVLLGRLAGLARGAAKDRAADLLAAFGLEKSAARQVKAFSGGMRRRLDLAASVIVRADLLFLDEPTTGLDPVSRAQVWEIIRSIVAGGATVLLTTQYMDEADALADRIAVIDHGTVIAEGTTGALKASVGSGTLRIRLADPAQRPDAGRLLTRFLDVAVQAGADPAALTARVPAGLSARPASERVAAAVTELARMGIAVGEFAFGQPSLDEVFLALTGHSGAGQREHPGDGLMTPATPGPAISTQTLRPMLPSGPRPRPPSALSASAAFGWRALLKIKHVPEQLFDVIAIPVVFTLMFTYLFGGALAGSASRYLQFILPGTLVMAVVLVTMYAGVGLNADASKGVSDRFRSLPIWRPAPIVGALLGDVARYLLAASLVVALGVAIGFRPAGGAPGVLAGIGLLVLFALSLSWAWTTLGLLMRTPQAVMSVGTVVPFPLTLASNVFVRPQTMPGWLQAFVTVNPVSHLVTAERGLIQGQAAAGQLGWVLLASAALVAVFAPVTVYLYGRQR
ncbi:MAG: ATP-binding cassette domain-containing protein [Streptosporangiaceae bacterium]